MRPLCAVLLLSSASVAQTSADMILRLERQQSAEDSRCIVVYSDATYHAERMHGSKTDVFEGTLDPARFAQAKDFAAGPLKQVQHEHMATGHFIDSPDLLSIDVDRGDDIQQIRFANKADRKPFDAQLNPVLQWFDATMKQPGARSTAKADRCVPEKKTTTKFVTGIPEKSTAGPENPYHIKDLLLLFITERYEGRGNSAGEKNCVLVRNDGSVYAYKMTIAWRQEPNKYREMRATVSPEQITELKRALDDPTLANAKDIRPDKGAYAVESDRTEVVAVRNNDVQDLHFLQFVNTEEVGANLRQGYQPVKGSDGSKETQPVRAWIKQNVDNSKLEKVEHLSGDCP